MIKKDIVFKWLEIEAYYKITSVLIIEDWADEEWKIYLVKLYINSYTTATKDWDLFQTEKELSWLRENELNITIYFNVLKQKEEFIWSIDC